MCSKATAKDQLEELVSGSLYPYPTVFPWLTRVERAKVMARRLKDEERRIFARLNARCLADPAE